MVSISGGWTTTVYAAIDPRVTRSYPVAGSLPIPLRVDVRDWGDWESNCSSTASRARSDL